MKPDAPKQLTKRQRKALKGPNMAATRSITMGKDFTVAGTQYRGTPAVTYYANYPPKRLPGLPFVRVS